MKRLPKCGQFTSSITVYMDDGRVLISTNLVFTQDALKSYNGSGAPVWVEKREDVAEIVRHVRGKKTEFYP